MSQDVCLQSKQQLHDNLKPLCKKLELPLYIIHSTASQFRRLLGERVTVLCCTPLYIIHGPSVLHTTYTMFSEVHLLSLTHFLFFNNDIPTFC